MAEAEAVIGNSSSGLMEAPVLKVPTVNIGDRQRGRIRAESVIDVLDSRASIIEGITKALTPEFRQSVRVAAYPFGDGYTAEKIVRVLKSSPLENLLMKKFVDLP